MYYFDKINDKKILKSSLIQYSQAFFTTRESVTTANALEDLKPFSEENIREIASFLKIPQESIISPTQTHSPNIAVAKKGNNYPYTDALILKDTDIAILLNFADCTPIIIIDEEKNIGAIAHAGWRGTAANITAKTVEILKNDFKCNPKNMKALIGPAISMKNYQVDKEVFEKLSSTLSRAYIDFYSYDNETGKFNLDLKTVNLHQLVEAGLDIQTIDKCDYCTYDSNDIFFSYRKENGKTARHSAILKLYTK